MSRRIIKSVKGYLSHKGKKWYAQIALNIEHDSGEKNREIKWIPMDVVYPGNKREAQTKVIEYVENYKKFIDKKIDPNVTIADFVPYFLEQIKPSVRRGTYEGYKLKSKHIVNYFNPKGTQLISLTRKSAREFYNYLLTEGKVINKITNERGALARTTVTDIKNLFCQIIDFAVEDELLISNPIQRMKLGKGGNKSKEKELLYMDFERSQEFIHYLMDKEVDIAELLIVCLNFGLRRSEVLGLTYNSIDFDLQRLMIRRTVTRVTTLHDEENTKSESGWREFMLNDEEMEFFKRVLSKKDQYKEFFGKTYVKSDFLFTWEDGKPYNPDYITKRTKKILMEFGEPNLTLHSLRHSYASILYEKGIDIKEAQYLMGHADSKVTLDIYIHIGRKKRQQAYTGLVLKQDTK